MSYYVSLGDVDFDNVASVNQSGERDISTYDSVGGGKFAVPQNKGLREWKIKFQSDDPDMFDDFDRMLRRKTPTRLIIKSDDDKVSERVLLKSYSKEESEYAGVYEVTVTVIEYAKVGVKTAAVPYVAREGTRVLPAQAVIGDGKGGTMTPYDIAKYAQDAARAVGEDAAAMKQVMAAQQASFDGETNAQAPQYVLTDPNNGKMITNPVLLKTGEKVNLYTYQNLVDFNDELNKPAFTLSGVDAAVNAWCDKTNKAMADAWRKFDEDFTKNATGK